MSSYWSGFHVGQLCSYGFRNIECCYIPFSTTDNWYKPTVAGSPFMTVDVNCVLCTVCSLAEVMSCNILWMISNKRKCLISSLSLRWGYVIRWICGSSLCCRNLSLPCPGCGLHYVQPGDGPWPCLQVCLSVLYVFMHFNDCVCVCVYKASKSNLVCSSLSGLWKSAGLQSPLTSIFWVSYNTSREPSLRRPLMATPLSSQSDHWTHVCSQAMKTLAAVPLSPCQPIRSWIFRTMAMLLRTF